LRQYLWSLLVISSRFMLWTKRTRCIKIITFVWEICGFNIKPGFFHMKYAVLYEKLAFCMGFKIKCLHKLDMDYKFD
jgi:hypothetical protein